MALIRPSAPSKEGRSRSTGWKRIQGVPEAGCAASFTEAADGALPRPAVTAAKLATSSAITLVARREARPSHVTSPTDEGPHDRRAFIVHLPTTSIKSTPRWPAGMSHRNATPRFPEFGTDTNRGATMALLELL